jgi:hypothetical protein
MGCDIHSRVQVLTPDKIWRTVEAAIFPSDYPDLFDGKSVWNKPTVEPFSWRSYGMFAFLAGVRNYSFTPQLSRPRGLPEDITSDPGFDRDETPYGDHSFSWFLLSELLKFDYDATFEDRRCMRDGSGVADAGAGNGKAVTFREFLGPLYFRDLMLMEIDCASKSPWGTDGVRVVFGFDN